MKKIIEDLILLIAMKAESVGLIIISIVSTWGIAKNGLGSFSDLRIGPRGLLAIWFGIGLILLSKKLARELER